jgi:hypothetical protein
MGIFHRSPYFGYNSIEQETPVLCILTFQGCRGDDFRGMPRAAQSAGGRPRSLHGVKKGRPAPAKGSAAPAAGWRLHRGEPEPGDEDEIPPTAGSPKVA